MPIPERMLTSMKQAQRVVLIAHVSPDGDTLGSALALRLALLAIGAVADVVCQDAVPELYATLPGAGTVVPPEKVAGRVYDLAVAVDVSDALRMGDCSPVFEAARSRMVVDHHGTNTRFGEENWVDPDASATGVLVLQLVRALGAELTPEIARCLFVALSTDTGHFQYQNTNAQALRAALRQAPNVILLGEMRDYETISTALTAAETGHALFSTLHTVGAAKTIDRIIDVFPANQQQQTRIQLSMVLKAVVSQQLIPTVDGSLVPAFEVMVVNSAVQNMIREGKVHQLDNVIYGGQTQGMMTMDGEIFRLYREGRISKENAVLYSLNAEQMRKRLM